MNGTRLLSFSLLCSCAILALVGCSNNAGPVSEPHGEPTGSCNELTDLEVASLSSGADRVVRGTITGWQDFPDVAGYVELTIEGGSILGRSANDPDGPLPTVVPRPPSEAFWTRGDYVLFLVASDDRRFETVENGLAGAVTFVSDRATRLCPNYADPAQPLKANPSSLSATAVVELVPAHLSRDLGSSGASPQK